MSSSPLNTLGRQAGIGQGVLVPKGHLGPWANCLRQAFDVSISNMLHLQISSNSLVRAMLSKPPEKTGDQLQNLLFLPCQKLYCKYLFNYPPHQLYVLWTHKVHSLWKGPNENICRINVRFLFFSFIKYLHLFIRTVIKRWQKKIGEVLKVVKIMIIAENLLKSSLGCIYHKEKKTGNLQTMFCCIGLNPKEAGRSKDLFEGKDWAKFELPHPKTSTLVSKPKYKL